MTTYCGITFTCKIHTCGDGKKIHQSHRGSIFILDDLYPSQVTLPEGCSYIDEFFEGHVEITSIIKKSDIDKFKSNTEIKLYEYPLLIAEGFIVSIDKMVDVE